jgi:hypothetical protein
MFQWHAAKNQHHGQKSKLKNHGSFPQVPNSSGPAYGAMGQNLPFIYQKWTQSIHILGDKLKALDTEIKHYKSNHFPVIS